MQGGGLHLSLEDRIRQYAHIEPLKGDGSYDSPECIERLLKADVVITNPPFSLAIDYFKFLMRCQKRFLFLCHKLLLVKSVVLPYIISGEVYQGFKNSKGETVFEIPKSATAYMKKYRCEGNRYYTDVVGITWLSNMQTKRCVPFLNLTETYTPCRYPKLDNHEAIYVDKTARIPKDYQGVMAVPVTFLNKYNPCQFTLLGLCRPPILNGETIFDLLLIQRK